MSASSSSITLQVMAPTYLSTSTSGPRNSREKAVALSPKPTDANGTLAEQILLQTTTGRGDLALQAPGILLSGCPPPSAQWPDETTTEVIAQIGGRRK